MLAPLVLLVAPAVQCGDEVPGTFQTVVAISGDWVVSGKEAAGVAHAHPRQGGGWGAGQPLVPASVEGGTMLGYAVAIDGTTAVVGRPLLGASAGVAHVFELRGGGWVETAELHAGDEAPFRHFGWSVDVDGDVIVVGAPRGGTGRAYVFERVGGAWTETARLEPGCCDGDQFGWSVAVSGDAALVGAPDADAPWPGSGKATAYRRGAAGWSVEQTLTHPFAALGFGHEAFGTSVALDGDLALVGAPGGTAWLAGPAGAGAAHLFAKGPSSWSAVASLVGADSAVGDDVGAAVALAGGVAVVGAPGHAEGGTAFTGAAYVFARDEAGQWPQAADLSQPPGFYLRGASVGTDGERAAVGATFDLAEVHDLAPSDALAAAPGAVSLAAGGAQALALDGGLLHAGLVHVVAGSATGSAPGTVVDGVLVPLVLDAYTLVTLTHAGSGSFVGTVGVLDACGEAAASLVVPAGASPALAGLTLHHAFVALSPAGGVALASDAEPLALVP